MKESLENYLNRLESQGFLEKETIGIDQVRALLRSSYKNIIASEKNLSIDEEACYTLAYNAMLKIARALVFLQSYRPSDGQQHKTTIEIAGRILGKEFSELIDIFDKMRKKRNQFTYDPMLPLSLTETKHALKTALDFYKKVKLFLDKKYPQLKLFES
jgi:uncharacterized protein (UPF0332 family)